MSGPSTGLSVAAGAALVASAALVLGLTVIGGVDQDTTAASIVTVTQLPAETCSITGPVRHLTVAEAANADTIVSSSMAASNESSRAARIALMAAMTESGLDDLDYGDQDSLGLFQERPSQGWGTPAQIMDPSYAADAFLNALHAHQEADHSWASQPLWANAQAVQGSAYPTAYAKWEAQAASLVQSITTR